MHQYITSIGEQITNI
jgi:hypothetical protein